MEHVGNKWKNKIQSFIVGNEIWCNFVTHLNNCNYMFSIHSNHIVINEVQYSKIMGHIQSNYHQWDLIFKNYGPYPIQLSSMRFNIQKLWAISNSIVINEVQYSKIMGHIQFNCHQWGSIFKNYGPYPIQLSSMRFNIQKLWAISIRLSLMRFNIQKLWAISNQTIINEVQYSKIIGHIQLDCHQWSLVFKNYGPYPIMLTVWVERPILALGFQKSSNLHHSSQHFVKGLKIPLLYSCFAWWWRRWWWFRTNGHVAHFICSWLQSYAYSAQFTSFFFLSANHPLTKIVR
jgi:hypothetical protein